MKLTQAEIADALEHNKIKWVSPNSTFWATRRASKTKLWKREPTRYQITVKMGLKSYAQLTNETEFNQVLKDGEFQFYSFR